MVLTAAAVTVAVLAVSCVRELDIPRPQTGGQAFFRLTPVCVDPLTKATIPGDDDFNENTIDGYFWFIYSDASGNTPVLSGPRGAKVDTEIPIDSKFPIQTGSTGYVYVVANLPEKPATPAAGDEWFELDSTAHQIKHVIQGGTTTTYNGTLTGLKTLSFGKNTPLDNKNSITDGQSEFYTYTSATTGVPDPERFVMRTEAPAQNQTLPSFTIENNTPVEVTAYLKRVAAKIIINLNIAKRIRQTKTNAAGQEIYEKTWDPDKEHVQIYMLWGSTHGSLSGDPLTYGTEGVDPKWFFSASPRYAMYQDPDGGYYNASTRLVEGSVPSEDFEENTLNIKTSVWEIVYKVKQDANDEPIWIWKDSVPAADRIPENEGDKAYGDWDYDKWVWYDETPEADRIAANIGNTTYGYESSDPIPVIGLDGNVQRQLTTQTVSREYWTIGSMPLYTMPITWSVNDANAPFIKIILPWYGKKFDNDGFGERIIEEDEKSTEFYYKVLLPNMTAVKDNDCYVIDLELAVLGSETDDVPVEIFGEYHVVDWNAPEPMGGDQSAGRYFNIASDTFDMYGNTLKIPVSASGPIVVTAINSTSGNPSATYPLGTSTNNGSLTYSTTSSTGTNFMVTPASNAKYVQVDHTVLPFSTSFSATNGNAKDVAKITYKFRVSLEGHPDLYKDITVTQYPSIYMERQQSRGYPFVNGNGNGTPDNNNDYTLGPVSNNAGTRSTYFTIVSISSLSGLATTYPDWVIGDPRIKLSDAYNGTYLNEPYYNVYTTSNNATRWLRTDLGSAPDYFDNYLVGDGDASNFVAPKFMLASGYGYRSSLTNSNWKSNSERCATYQEDGYPAGRWRLPTEAEILFCATLASHGLIESPFVNNTRYWATSGGNLQYTSNGTNWNFSYTYDQGTVSIRCIYDLWYWGDAPVVTPGNYSVMLPE